MASCRLATSIALAVSLVCGGHSAAHAKNKFTPLLTNGLKGWTADRAKPSIKSGIVTLERGIGWLTLDRPLANFIVRMDVRLATPDAKAGIVVRTWRTFNPRTGVPTNAYVIAAAAGEPNVEMIGSILEYGPTGPGRRFDATAPRDVVPGVDTDGWHHYEIECVDDAIRVTIDGRLVSEAVKVQNSRGLLGLSVAAGRIELRNIALRELADPEPKLPDGVFAAKDVILPRVKREVKPRYTREAMGAQIQGTVWIEAVVQRDGIPTDLKIIRSLDPDYGLDREALRAASEWRFTPGMKDGQPVPVAITIELTFTLKR